MPPRAISPNKLVAVAGLFRRRHGVGLRLDDVGALALGFLEQHRPHGAEAGARRRIFVFS
jgi:hypothetical protein